MDERLLKLLGCPVDKSELELRGQRLICPVCGRVYPIVNGIPQLLVGDYGDYKDKDFDCTR